MELENTVLLGDCLVILRQIPDETFHAVVTDAPYGLGGKEPTPEEVKAFIMGSRLDTGGDFMNQDWEIPSVEVWKEVFRVLKPGGHVLCFGGTRTWDLISLGLRMAGFENRNTIADEFPGLQWMYGQGMPKSHNIAKALDKKAGIEQDPKFERTVPVTAQAKVWDGYGTGLKPSWEPIVVFRKPFRGTVVDNVLKHGAGALNIDGCRVRHSSKADFEAHKSQVDAVKAKGGVRDGSWKNASDLSGASDVTEAGRWPTNTILQHAPGCRKVISRSQTDHSLEGSAEMVKTWECVEGCPVAILDRQSGNRPSMLTGQADPDGIYEHPGKNISSKSTFLGKNQDHLSRVYADDSGASRFFPQFESAGRWPSNAILTHHPDCRIVGFQKVDAPVLNRFDDGAKPFGNGAGYPHTSIQTGDEDGKENIPIWECVEGCPVKALDEQSGELISGSGAVKKATAKGYQGTVYGKESRPEGTPQVSHADSGGASRFFEQFQSPFNYIAKPSKRETSLEGQIENDHPTRKPLELMKWLVRLVTFRGAYVLDPYCGSGATLHAAAEEGVIYTGIDKWEHAYDIATRRMDIVLGREKERQAQMDVFDFAMELGDEDNS